MVDGTEKDNKVMLFVSEEESSNCKGELGHMETRIAYFDETAMMVLV